MGEARKAEAARGLVSCQHEGAKDLDVGAARRVEAPVHGLPPPPRGVCDATPPSDEPRPDKRQRGWLNFSMKEGERWAAAAQPADRGGGVKALDLADAAVGGVAHHGVGYAGVGRKGDGAGPAPLRHVRPEGGVEPLHARGRRHHPAGRLRAQTRVDWRAGKKKMAGAQPSTHAHPHTHAHSRTYELPNLVSLDNVLPKRRFQIGAVLGEAPERFAVAVG